jgi:hypothetical protein
VANLHYHTGTGKSLKEDVVPVVHPCHGLSLPACKLTLSEHDARCTRQAILAVYGRCWATEHTHYCIAAGPLMPSVTASIGLHVSKSCQNMKQRDPDKRFKHSMAGAGLQNTPAIAWQPVLSSSLSRPPFACM